MKTVVIAMKSSHILHVGYVGTLNTILLVLLAYNTDFDIRYSITKFILTKATSVWAIFLVLGYRKVMDRLN